jgi:hypothetical protein
MDENRSPHVKFLGDKLNGVFDGMVLNFTYKNWSPICQTDPQYCSEVISIHEFGHALGFAHEQNRPDTPNFCTDDPQGTDGDTIIGAWDLYSVMNYCNPAWNGRGTLSKTDIVMVRKFYGSGNILKMERWTTRQGGFWNEQQWFSGDFNGDGIEDVAKAFNQRGKGSIDVHISNGSSFTIQRWATRQGGFWNEQQWFAGDFNGDGKDDVAKAFNERGKGSIDVHISNGSSFTMQRWATRQGGFWNEQQWFAGDFNGDGKDDVAKAFNERGKGSIDVHISNGSSFTMQRWTTRQGGFWNEQQWFTGDFNGDGMDDVAKAFYDGALSSIDVNVSFGSFFKIQRWATRQGGFWNDQQWFSGDFNGDGKDDVTKAFNVAGQGSIDVHLSTDGSFTIHRWATRQGGFWNEQQWFSGDFDGDGIDDFVKSFNQVGKASIDVHRR